MRHAENYCHSNYGVAWQWGSGLYSGRGNQLTLFRRVRNLLKELAGEKKKMSLSNRTLIFVGALLITYTITDLIVFMYVGSEPYTLTACVFGVCGLESGVLGWIKTT